MTPILPVEIPSRFRRHRIASARRGAGHMGAKRRRQKENAT